MRPLARAVPRFFCAAGLLSILVSGPEIRSASAPSYAVQDLGALGGSTSQGFGVSATHGKRVTGAATTAFESQPGPDHAFLWDAAHPAEGPQDLGALKLAIWDESYARSFDDSISVAYGINDAGHVVGRSTTVSYHHHAFFWSDLNGDRDGREPHNGADGPLDRGPVAGEYEILDLDPQNQYSRSAAQAINNQDQIAGWGSVSTV